MESEADDGYAFLWKWRKYLLLLATLVASVTYVAGLNPPGGVWPDNRDGHLTGDPVLPVTYFRRYVAFYNCNATAFVASLVIIILLLNKKVSSNRVGLAVLRSAMVLDLLGLMGAYAAGSCREVLESIYVAVLFIVVVAYVALHILVASSNFWTMTGLQSWVDKLKVKLNEWLNKGEAMPKEQQVEDDLKQRRKLLMLLATFATAITYGAGLGPPGGFWLENKSGEGGHLAGDPVLQDEYTRRFKAFFFCNATAFVASLAIIMLLMTRTLSEQIIQSYALRVCVMVELLGLMSAFVAGSCRKADTTIYLICLVGAVLAYIVLQMVIGIMAMSTNHKRLVMVRRMLEDQEQPGMADENDAVQVQYRHVEASPVTPDIQSSKLEKDNEGEGDKLEQSRGLLLLLATLASTVTYQAGLNPPGGVWPDDDQDGHRAADPVLLATYTKRYKAFFYCNTMAFVASLVIIVMVQSKRLSSGQAIRRHALQATMILDLFALMAAYTAGSSRDMVTSIYVSALSIAVFVYVLLRILASRWGTKLTDNVKKHLKKPQLSGDIIETAPDDNLERRRKLLLTLAILAATITYQAGLTPPGGFWSDNNDGHQAGHPVLLDHYPARYKAFFYCNATGFMASLAVILLLVNQRLYKQGIQCNALHACVIFGLLGVMGAYAAGSCRSVLTSIYVFALVAAVVTFVFFQMILSVFANFVVPAKLKSAWPQWLLKLFNPLSPLPTQSDDRNANNRGDPKQDAKRKYLMLLGILAASVTYQAGLAPPGGLWGADDDSRGHAAGNPVLHDTNQSRYRAFFYCNATSFMASMVVIILLLQRTLRSHNVSLWAMQSVVVLDLLGLLGAYAAGSCRDWQTSVYVLALVVAVLVYIAVHVLLSFDTMERKVEKLWKYCGLSSD